MSKVYDVAVIGGGINGCGCAADASLRGLSVVLLEKDDLASKTSSKSTKLIHGGLRYLEHYEFKLVKKALNERQTLLNLAPHLVRPQPFVLPYQKHMRPAWFIRLGLFFYDNLSKKNHLPKCKSVYRNQKSNYFSPLKNAFNKGFLFYDAATDDARLTISNAKLAKIHGADIRTNSNVVKVESSNNLWQLTIEPKIGPSYTITAKSLINAAGPWVESIAKMTKISDQHKMTLVQGSHILVPKMYEGDQAYFLQHSDDRVIFVIPYFGFSMIGTTEVAYKGALDAVHITTKERDYLLQLVNTYFNSQLKAKDIVYSWSGLRPLLSSAGKDLKSLSRDYSFELQLSPAPIITIYGGKITTYRQLSEEIINQLQAVFPSLKPSLSKQTPLPGAIFHSMTYKNYVAYAREKYNWLGKELLDRLLITYGTCMEEFLSTCTSIESLGIDFGSSLFQAEVDYLVREEWAINCEDILDRRTKLGLTMSEAHRKQLELYLSSCSK